MGLIVATALGKHAKPQKNRTNSVCDCGLSCDFFNRVDHIFHPVIKMLLSLQAGFTLHLSVSGVGDVSRSELFK